MGVENCSSLWEKLFSLVIIFFFYHLLKKLICWKNRIICWKNCFTWLKKVSIGSRNSFPTLWKNIGSELLLIVKKRRINFSSASVKKLSRKIKMHYFATHSTFIYLTYIFYIRFFYYIQPNSTFSQNQLGSAFLICFKGKYLLFK